MTPNRPRPPAGDEHIPILPAALSASIGEFIACWAGTATLLTLLLADLVAGKSLTDEDDIGPASVVIGMGTRIQLGLVKTLGNARTGKRFAPTIHGLVDELEKSKAQRDFLAHAIWSPGTKGRMVAHSVKTVGKARYVKRSVSPVDVHKHIVALTKTSASLVKFFQTHGFLSAYTEGSRGRFY